ncbi:dethiobiotin synthase [Herbaspirillum sp. LeCh32-8]|uniref:dethiobiotin synthase n=1 Tax=Herbaspirillum sp. LeCh32-8 TaxID=2821356 RepID=UPI001AE8F85E|nr:dethiobiotin synthase [Herbaspirillum sp. LeCh32-8]MBP0597398.1 dethiobiotin synthase [Herbaspirillum sp. LeCh32-8]
MNKVIKDTPRARGYFVTGTDTGVGKTLVASALVHLHAARGLRSAGMKPVASGASFDGERWRNDDADALSAASNLALPPALVNPFLFRSATAPHLAAREEGKHISIDHLERCYRDICAAAEVVIVEGAGGFLVPLDDDHNSDALAARLRLPAIMVVGIRLGCINHALLTQLAIRAKSLPLAGWVANHIDADEPYAQAMVESLTRRIDAPLLGELPWMDATDAGRAAQLLDAAALGLPAVH